MLPSKYPIPTSSLPPRVEEHSEGDSTTEANRGLFQGRTVSQSDAENLPKGMAPQESSAPDALARNQLSELLNASDVEGIRARDISTHASDISTLLKQKIQVAIENITQKHRAHIAGITFTLKELHITATTPANIEAIVKCTAPKGERENANMILGEIYEAIVSILTTYIDEHDEDYKSMRALSHEEQRELCEHVREALKDIHSSVVVEDILSFKNNKPVLSISPLCDIQSEEKQSLLAMVEGMCATWKSCAIFFTGEFHIEEQEKEARTMKIKAHRNPIYPNKIIEKSEEEDKHT